MVIKFTNNLYVDAYPKIASTTILHYKYYQLTNDCNHQERIHDNSLLKNYILDYKLTASLSTTLTISNGVSSQPIFNTVPYNPNNFYNTTTGKYSVNNTPNTGLNFILTGTASAITSTAELNLQLITSGSGFGNTTIDNSPPYYINVGTPLRFTWTGSYSTLSPWFDPITLKPIDQLGLVKSI